MPVYNEASRDIALSTETVIAQVYSTDTFTVAQGDKSISTTINPKFIQFGTSFVPEAWKKCLHQMLAEKGNVFSLKECDVELVNVVEHHIKLSDRRLFRERSRRIAPAYIENVRRHIKDLMATGIIYRVQKPICIANCYSKQKKNGAVRMRVDYRTLNQ